MQIVPILANLIITSPLHAMYKNQTKKAAEQRYYACEPCRKLHAACDDQEICGTCLVNETEHLCYRAQRKPSSSRRKRAVVHEDFHGWLGYSPRLKSNTQVSNQDLLIISHEGRISDDFNGTITLWPEKFYKECWADNLEKRMAWGIEETGQIKDEVARASLNSQCYKNILYNGFCNVAVFTLDQDGSTEVDMDTSECIKQSVSAIAKQDDEQWLDSILKEESPY